MCKQINIQRDQLQLSCYWLRDQWYRKQTKQADAKNVDREVKHIVLQQVGTLV